MIPKIIHFCWLSNEPYPELIKRCMRSWQEQLPNYEIKKWDVTNFDINSIPFVKEAYMCKKWAFAADYIRLYALFTEGGIYLDSDVFLKRNFDRFLNNSAFSSIEYNPQLYPIAIREHLIDKEGNVLCNKIRIGGIQIQAAVIGSEKGNIYIKKCMEYYHSQSFILSDNSLNTRIILPDIMAYCAREFGFKYINKEQNLKNVKLFESEIFAPHPKLSTKYSYAIHCCTGKWKNKSLVRKFIDYLRYKMLVK